MMSAIYELIGRAVVGFVRRRYGQEIRAAAIVGAAGAVVAIAAYVATRDGADEG